MVARLSHRPVLVALLLGLAAQVLFSVHLGRPDRLTFDETHYVPAARMLLSLAGPTNLEHPLVGKTLIAASIALFGDDPVGWRALSTVAGSLTVAGMFALLWLLTGRMRPAVGAALLAALNQMLFIQARIAMLDVFLGVFVLWGLVALLAGARGGSWSRWVAGSVSLGLATGVKWVAGPYVAFAALALLLFGRGGRSRLPMLPAMLVLGLVSVATYFATFLPAFFYASEPMTVAKLLPFQLEMYALQTEILHPHPYQSSWWTWPLMIRPIWYFYEPDLDAVRRGVLLLGNPVVLWGGLVAVAACWVAAIRERAARPLAVALLWTASLAIWAAIPKSLGFFYYYYLSALFLCAVIAVAFDHYDRGRAKGWDEWFVGAAAVAFAYFYPVLSAGALNNEMAFERWTWFLSWR